MPAVKGQQGARAKHELSGTVVAIACKPSAYRLQLGTHAAIAITVMAYP